MWPALMCALLPAPRVVPVPHAPAGRPAFVSVRGRRFVEPSGRPLLLHGIAIDNKSRRQGYTAGIERSDFAAIRRWGMNCVRLAIFWDGIEPQPGHIDEAYLQRVSRLVSWARAEHLMVLLDMHQDLYSVKFSDGAPEWATLDEGKPHVTGAIWSESYYMSGAVQTALDHFWANSRAPDGKGLQDHYAFAWRAVAERFKDEPAVLGYDLMNEPFAGHNAARFLQVSMQRVADLLRAGGDAHAPSLLELAAMGSTARGRRKLMGLLGDMRIFTGMLDAAAPITQDFERTCLMPMYERVRTEIRAVDRNHILFMEPAMSSNIGIRTAIVPLTDEEGRRDPQQAYAPHGYDLITDTDMLDLCSGERLALIFSRHGETARKLELPMLVGEWGALPGGDVHAAGTAKFIVQQFDRLGCGDTYWDYQRSLGRSALPGALRRSRVRQP
jgi:endoglycosylceramidase